ncbi:MAG: MFS transporter [Alphaproteobacteria bacterium]|nr:MFS transporter [Alphaproteobacteria bacterium]
MIARALTNPDHARTRSLIAAILCAALAGAGFGLLMPLVSLNLESMTGSGAVVGANATAAAISTIVMTPLIPFLLSRLPSRAAMASASVFTGLGIAAFPFLPDVYAWWVLRFVTGCAVTLIFVGSETWINQLAKPEHRASLLAAYATVLSAGFGSGGLMLAALGSQGYAPWFAGAAIFVLGAIPILILRGPDLVPPTAGETGLKALIGAARLAPPAILAGLVFGAMETGVFTLVPVYAERLGFAEAMVGIIVAAAALGGIALQIPVGRIADRVGRLTTLRAVAAAGIVLPLLAALAGATLTLLLPMVFLFAGLASAFYTLGLALMGERVQPGALASANAAFIFAYGIGSLVGPPVMGAAMDGFDPFGLMIAFSVLAALYLLFAWREKDTGQD